MSELAVNPQSVIHLARECLGTPFVHQGRIPGKALDCAGVLVYIFNGLGLPYSDEIGYPRRPYKGQLEAGLARQPHLKRVAVTELQPGDIVLFRVKAAPQHIGVYTGATLIHAAFDPGRVVEQRFASWAGNLTHAYRVVL